MATIMDSNSAQWFDIYFPLSKFWKKKWQNSDKESNIYFLIRGYMRINLITRLPAAMPIRVVILD